MSIALQWKPITVCDGMWDRTALLPPDTDKCTLR